MWDCHPDIAITCCWFTLIASISFAPLQDVTLSCINIHIMFHIIFTFTLYFYLKIWGLMCLKDLFHHTNMSPSDFSVILKSAVTIIIHICIISKVCKKHSFVHLNNETAGRRFCMCWHVCTSRMTSVLDRQRPLQKLTSTLSSRQSPLVIFLTWT